MGKSPARVAAGRWNRLLRGPLTEEGRRQLREAALQHQPWLHSTGPRTAAGKAAVAANGRRFKKGVLSVAERKKIMAEVNGVVTQAAKLRRMLMEGTGAAGGDS